MFVWISLTTRQQAVNDFYPHIITMSTNGDITILYSPLQQSEPNDETDGETSATDTAPDATFVPAPVSLSIQKINGISTWRRFMALQATTADGDTTILIPVSAFTSDTEAAEFYGKLAESTKASLA